MSVATNLHHFEPASDKPSYSKLVNCWANWTYATIRALKYATIRALTYATIRALRKKQCLIEFPISCTFIAFTITHKSLSSFIGDVPRTDNPKLFSHAIRWTYTLRVGCNEMWMHAYGTALITHQYVEWDGKASSARIVYVGRANCWTEQPFVLVHFFC